MRPAGCRLRSNKIYSHLDAGMNIADLVGTACRDQNHFSYLLVDDEGFDPLLCKEISKETICKVEGLIMDWIIDRIRKLGPDEVTEAISILVVEEMPDSTSLMCGAC